MNKNYVYKTSNIICPCSIYILHTHPTYNMPCMIGSTNRKTAGGSVVWIAPRNTCAPCPSWPSFPTFYLPATCLSTGRSPSVSPRLSWPFAVPCSGRIERPEIRERELANHRTRPNSQISQTDHKGEGDVCEKVPKHVGPQSSWATESKSRSQ